MRESEGSECRLSPREDLEGATVSGQLALVEAAHRSERGGCGRQKKLEGMESRGGIMVAQEMELQGAQVEGQVGD